MSSRKVCTVQEHDGGRDVVQSVKWSTSVDAGRLDSLICEGSFNLIVYFGTGASSITSTGRSLSPDIQGYWAKQSQLETEEKMSCICQFHTPGVDSARSLSALPLPTNDASSSTAVPLTDVGPEELIEESNDANTAVSASDLADCRAENWLLRKKLREYEVTIENLEQLVSTLVEKQHQILSEMFNLRAENHELQSECHLQREYHSMERNALLKQLHDSQTLYQNRASALESRSSNGNDNPNCVTGEPPINSGSSCVGSEATFTAQSDNEDQCEYGSDSNEERESNSEEENEDLSAESSAQSSECSSPIPTCSESGDSDLDDDLYGENSPNSNSETD